jgi:uncharacterized membrane protein
MEEEKKQAETSTSEESVINEPVSEEKDIQNNKMWALLSYLGALVVIPLVMKNDSPFVQFHIKQGLVILIGWMLSWLPFGPIFGIVAFVFSIIGIINVLNGEMKKLPIVGDLAEKIKL